MRPQLSALALTFLFACSRPPPLEVPSPCTAGGPQDPIVLLDGGATAPPGWTTVELEFDHPVACFQLVHEKLVREDRNDAGFVIGTTWADDLPALAVDHPALGSRITVAVRGNRWWCHLRWDDSSGSLSANFLPQKLGGSMRLVPPTRAVGMSGNWPEPEPESETALVCDGSTCEDR